MMRFDALALQIFQKKEELLFCEICDPRGPRALGPQYGFFGRAGSVIAGVGKGDGRGRTTRFERYHYIRCPELPNMVTNRAR